MLRLARYSSLMAPWKYRYWVIVPLVLWGLAALFTPAQAQVGPAITKLCASMSAGEARYSKLIRDVEKALAMCRRKRAGCAAHITSERWKGIAETICIGYRPKSQRNVTTGDKLCGTNVRALQASAESRVNELGALVGRRIDEVCPTQPEQPAKKRGWTA